MRMTAICDNPACPSDECQLHQARWRIRNLEDALRAVQRLRIIYDGPPRNNEYDSEAAVSLQIRTVLDANKTDLKGGKVQFTRPPQVDGGVE